MSFGEANYGSKNSFKKKNYAKLENGSKVFFIVPPHGAANETGTWAVFYKVHFGYKNLAGKLRTFLSPEKWNEETSKYVAEDAALDRINNLKADLDTAIKAKDRAETTRLNFLVGQKGIYNIDKNWHMNAIDLQGNVVELKIRHKAKLALDAELKKLVAKGIKPHSFEDGRYFVFTRTGNGNETQFKVDVYTETLNLEGREVESPVSFSVNEQFKARVLTEVSDLSDLFESITPEEVRAIVEHSDLMTGKSPACDEIFDTHWKAERAAKQSPQANQTQTSFPKANNPPAAANTPPDDEPGSDYVAPTTTQASVPAALAPVTPPSTKTPEPTARVATKPVVNLEDQSDEDFFKSIENAG